MKKYAVKLLGITYSTNDMGDPIETSTKKEILAERKSVRQSEFYQAQATGLRPELTFVVWADEYNGEPKLEYAGKEYTIIRTFDKDEKNLELICQGLVSQ